MGATNFQQLEVWKKAHAFVLSGYRMTAKFPHDERFGLTSQMRRSMVSIPANIAEGFSKKGKADKSRYYNIAEGSLEETRYYLILAQDLGYVETSRMMVDLDEVGRMLRSYSAAINASRFVPGAIVRLFSFFF